MARKLWVAGLADDIDAISAICRSGSDMVLRFDDGTRVVFVGMADGPITSVAGLIDDPFSQITSQYLLT